MSKFLLSVTLVISALVMTSCTTTQPSSPAYINAYTAVDSNRPHWDSSFYSGFGYSDNLVGSGPFYNGVGPYSSGWYTGY